MQKLLKNGILPHLLFKHDSQHYKLRNANLQDFLVVKKEVHFI